VRGFFVDVQEALETKTSHYLGTLVLAQTGTMFEIVDGQQRLSTIMLMVHGLLAQLATSDPVRIADEIYLLNQGSDTKLDFGTNREFVADLFSAHNPTPNTGGQRRLAEAYRHCFERAQAIHQNAGDSGIHTWLDTVKNLEIIAFTESDTGRAIRMFQSVNDRGRPLTAMDKAKALLVLYSNRFLNGKLDDRINQAFGTCFSAYDRMREQASQSGYKIELISRTTFTEDDLLRYHYLSYDASEASDYYGYSQTVLDDFLKPALKTRQGNTMALHEFISDYVEDLEAFAQAFAGLVDATRSDTRMFTLLVVHSLAARLYPITIRLYQRGLLFEQLSNATPAVDLLHCLEVVDLRVYKLRGTDPAKDIGHLSHKSRKATVDEIAASLRTFVMAFMPNGLMETQLGQWMYKNGATVPILFALGQFQPYTLQKLVTLIQDVPTQEHILSQEPSFDCTAYGFDDSTEFEDYLNRIGNLTLLTAAENTRCQNKSVKRKMSQQDLYPSSKFVGTRRLANQFTVSGAVFDKNAVIARIQELKHFALTRWAIW